MSKLFKLIFLALLSAFIVGCGHHSGGSSSKSDNTTLGDDNTSTIDDNNTKDDNGTTDDNTTTDNNGTTEDNATNTTAIEAFMSDFPVFDDGGKPVDKHYITAQYGPISADEAKAVNTTLTGDKDFYISDDYSNGDMIEYSYKPNYDITTKNLYSAYALVLINSSHSESTFSLSAENRTILYGEIDDIFGAVNSTIGYVELEILYDDVADMSAEYSAYYQQLLDSGVFEVGDCYVADDEWSCYKDKGDGTFYYYWYASGHSSDWLKGTYLP
jgi:hypothetical protein